MSSVPDDGHGHHVVLGLGANLGDPIASLRSAIALIDSDSTTHVVAQSSFYATAPVGGPPQPDYVNAVVIVTTTRDPAQMLALAHTVEAAHDRVRAERWGPRTLDIDVIAYDDVVSDDPALTLPHPLAHERGFVLVPWCEVEPDAQLPGRGAIADLMTAVSDQRIVKVDESSGAQ